MPVNLACMSLTEMDAELGDKCNFNMVVLILGNVECPGTAIKVFFGSWHILSLGTIA